jgi:hypothetical protein
MADRPPARVLRAKRSLVKALSGKPGFVGAGVAQASAGRYEIVVMVVEKTSAILTEVPGEWEGIPVKTQISGAPRKF